MADDVDPELEGLLDFIRDERGFDFTGYKRASLTRRIRKRMQDVGIEELPAYHDHLQVHPEEFTHLFNTILINVTRFFRDPEGWEFLAHEVVPRILERKRSRDDLRVWSVGVASGEEAYTLAMVLAEAVGLERLGQRVKIYATDVDEEALTQARSGEYPVAAVESIPDELRERYLVEAPGGFAFRKELRRAVVFGRHDLLTDAPISRVDLIVCRNTLIYFNADVQARIYASFQFALRPDGYLFLGKAERFSARSDRFESIDPNQRVYARVARDGERSHDRTLVREEGRVAQALAERLRLAVFESATTAQIVLDARGALIGVNGLARALFGLTDSDANRVFYELELSYRPVELRSRIDQALAERRSVVEQSVAWTAPSGQRYFLQVEVVPLFYGDEPLGAMIAFVDVTNPFETSNQLERARRELETAYEEIQSTVEELETTNEELQSTNEELETMNEELQSTNEELETMNEELQSTNEELSTVNAELTERTDQLNQSTAFLESVIESLGGGVVVLNHDFTIASWNSGSEELWGLRADEVRGKNLFALDIGLPVGELRETIRDCLNGTTDHTARTVEAVNRRGQQIRCRVTCTAMNDLQRNHHGAILIIESI